MLSKYIPQKLYNEPTLNKVYSAQETQLTEIYNNITDLINQKFISTATWNLSDYESDLGIPIVETDSYDIRRTRILAKLRGYGTITKEMIQNVAESFENGEVDIIPDYANYSFTVKLVCLLGIPPNIDDLMNAIEEIKPAHMAVIYLYSYLLINEVDGVMTINQLEATPLNKFAGGE